MTVHAISEIRSRNIDPAGILPVVSLSQNEYNRAQLIAAARSDTGYNNPDEDEYNTDFASAADARTSREQHQKGVLGEAAYCKYYEGSVQKLDDRITRHGDGGIDVVSERDTATIHVDVKTTDWGYADGSIPHLKIRREKHRTEENLIYYLCERINATTARLVGYIHSERVPEAGVEVDEGEVAFADEPRKRFKSNADNYVIPAPKLTAVWREWDDD